ncbi:MAG TPA: hypothetical protein VE689_06055 [Candidatus Udaeobacter sp.]|nr:hypothetical protein [Candidatus Udaeobacter sp.]
MEKSAEPQSATLNGAEAAVEMLKAHGVEILFGLCWMQKSRRAS